MQNFMHVVQDLFNFRLFGVVDWTLEGCAESGVEYCSILGEIDMFLDRYESTPLKRP